MSRVDSTGSHPVWTSRSTTIVDNTYNAAHLLVLEGLEAVRKRPGMYIGSTDTRGLMHCLWEIIDNGVDEALAAAAKRIEVTLHRDDSAEVYIGDEFIGTLTREDAAGELCYQFQMAILEMDLADA